MERNKKEERRHTWGSGVGLVWPKCGAHDRGGSGYSKTYTVGRGRFTVSHHARVRLLNLTLWVGSG